MKRVMQVVPFVVSALVMLLVPLGVITLDWCVVILMLLASVFGWAFMIHYWVVIPKWWRTRFGRVSIFPVFLLTMLLTLGTVNFLRDMPHAPWTWLTVAIVVGVFVFHYQCYTLLLLTRRELRHESESESL